MEVLIKSTQKIYTELSKLISSFKTNFEFKIVIKTNRLKFLECITDSIPLLSLLIVHVRMIAV